jgi:vibriolysin
MMMRRLRQAPFIALTLAACSPNAPSGSEPKDDDDMSDVQQALAALPEAQVLMSAPDGMPTYVVGELAKVGDMQIDDAVQADNVLRPQLTGILKVFRLSPNDLKLRKMNVDAEGSRHFRYVQTKDGQEIVGGDLVVHVDVKGAVYGVNGSARGDVSLGNGTISQSQAAARVNGDGRFAGLSITNTRSVLLQAADGAFYKTYETTVEGSRGKDPARDKVYVDIASGNIVAVYPQIHFAENRKAYSANNGTTLPGTLKRSEGQAATTDVDVNAAYDNTGATYEAYKNFWNRDSYNNAGAQLTSSVHYSTNYCNAFWNGTQMVYGDGSASQGCAPLARAVDVTAHEMTHAVTENESGLVYSGESGGMNEALSDIFGAFVEAWVDGGKNGTLQVSNDTWLVGEEILPPALRWMCDPAQDGASADVWSSSVGNLDVHYSSGVPNLAFCLLSKGGTHPRGKTTVNVPGIGMDKAIRIAYEAQVNIMTSNTNMAGMRTAMEQAATNLGYDQATKDAVGCAWAAVKVGTAPTTCGGSPPPPPPPPPGGGVLTNNTPVSNLSGATGSDSAWTIVVPSGQTNLTVTITGGTGDADMYVKFGSAPTSTVYDCRPYLNGNAETCTFSPPSAGTYYINLHGYAAYSGVTLKASYSATTGGDPYLTNGVGVTGISGATSSAKYWRIAAPAGKTLTVKISGGSGDADLYTRFGSRPTTTTYSCRPYLTGNTETCTTTGTQAGDYYIMLRGYAAYSGVTLIGSY